MEAKIVALTLFTVLTFVYAVEDDTLEKEGLKINIIKKNPHCPRKAAKGDQVSVHYTGFLMNGKEFDSSRKRNQPFVITLGQGMVIPGWEEGLLGMCVGEERKLVIAPELAYGEHGFGDIIPGGSTLIFDIELLEISDSPETEASSEEPTEEIPPLGSSEESDDIFSQIDADGDRQINIEEMANHIMKHEGKTKDDDKTELYTMVGEIFQEDDKNKDGVLSYDEFMTQATEHDEL
ncbi:peptidyl-prolyl cis-trans isomerase FKBP2-like [Rhopilema esculentum]|uniref:peptidyl-prolyl cis-trans isomerase FKBP2-like n=1 Tax=Rhopilema esculentum TaxID=499914 RepID=UPI0031D9A6D6|eukprot:gene12658-3367_t